MIEYLAPLYMAFVSRLAGSPYKYFGLVLYPVPYVLVILSNIDLTNKITAFCYLFGAYAWVFGWKITGHSDGFRNYVRDNFLSKYVVFLSSFFGVKRDSQVYDFWFWSIKGGLIALVPTAIFAVNSGDYKPALAIFCASFCGYPCAYWLGFNHLNGKLMVNTAWGELLAGFFAGLGFLLL